MANGSPRVNRLHGQNNFFTRYCETRRTLLRQWKAGISLILISSDRDHGVGVPTDKYETPYE
jgi:hypothetical protein